MYYFNWTADLNLGIKVIDSQHKCVADYINLLQGAIELNDYADAVYCADKLVEYTDELFVYEEALLKQSDYELTEPHIAAHERFKETAKKYQKAIQKSKDMMIVKQMCSELTLWLTEHIKREDTDFVDSVNRLYQKDSMFNGLFNFFTMNNKLVKA